MYNFIRKEIAILLKAINANPTFKTFIYLDKEDSKGHHYPLKNKLQILKKTRKCLYLTYKRKLLVYGGQLKN